MHAQMIHEQSQQVYLMAVMAASPLSVAKTQDSKSLGLKNYNLF